MGGFPPQGRPYRFADLYDVSITSPIDEHIIDYSAALAKWRNLVSPYLKDIPMPEAPVTAPSYALKNSLTLGAGAAANVVDIAGSGTVRKIDAYIDAATLAGLESKVEVIVDGSVIDTLDFEGFADMFERCQSGYNSWDNNMGLAKWDTTAFILGGFLQYPLGCYPFNSSFILRMTNEDLVNALTYSTVALWDEKIESYMTRIKTSPGAVTMPSTGGAGQETSLMTINGSGVIKHIGIYFYYMGTPACIYVVSSGFKIKIDDVVRLDCSDTGFQFLFWIQGSLLSALPTTTYKYGNRGMETWDNVDPDRHIAGFLSYPLVNWKFDSKFEIIGVNQCPDGHNIMGTCKALWHQAV